MDPQLCLSRIVDAVRTENQPGVDREHAASEVAEAFDALHQWLRGGGFPPVATGPIFGVTRVAVGYPGMPRGAGPRYVERPVSHVATPTGLRAQFAIMTEVAYGPAQFAQWVFVAYDFRGNETRRWRFGTDVPAPNS